MELLFGIHFTEEILPVLCLGDREQELLHTKVRVDSLPTPENVNRRQMLLLYNQPLRNHPDTVVLYLSTSREMYIKGPTAYFISDQDSKKRERTQHTYHWWNSQHTRGKTYANILVSNYTYKHIIFNKGEYVGHIEPPIEDMQQIPKDEESLTAHSTTTRKDDG